MEGRTRLAIGGMATVAASIAVVCAVAMTTSVALAHAPGAVVGTRPVIVPSSGATPSPVPTSSAAPVAAETSVTEPETVPAPEPEDVAAPPAAMDLVGEPSMRTEDQIIAEVAASGSWDAMTEGTSDKSTSRDSSSGNRLDPLLPAETGDTSGRELSGSSSGSKRERSRVPPD